MGSVLSFPLLCAANFICIVKAIYRKCDAHGHPRPELKDIPAVINGDDILYIADSELYGYWRNEIALVGFTLSPGKNLTSKQYFTVNSSLY
jgi:hypothetical protein